MSRKRSVTDLFVIIAIVIVVLMLLILPTREYFDSSVLHYTGDDKIMGCLYVVHPDAHGREVKDKGACQSYSQKELLSFKAMQHSTKEP